MAPPVLTPAKRRVLEHLKQGGPSTASALARELSLTDVAVRQHLTTLEQAGLVTQAQAEPNGPGRPPVRWSLTDLAAGLFPDGHSDLAVQLLNSMRVVIDEAGLAGVLGARTDAQLAIFGRALGSRPGSIGRRIRVLAEIRTAEGYMAAACPDGGDGWVLTENHCPIAGAARCCAGLCDTELELFRRALGAEVTVERSEHLLSGDHRCVYRVRPA